MSPSVSIITPVKANEKKQRDWLYHAVQSVLNQTYTDWEMVIVDDDSPEDLGVVRRLCADDRIHWLEGGGGCVASRNKAAEHARSDFLLPLDADDKLAPNALNLYLRGWEQGGKDAGFVYSDVMVFGEGYSRLIQAPYYDFTKLLHTTYISVGGLHKKSDWEHVGGWRADMEAGLEDWEYWIALGEQGVCGWRVEQPLYWYRRHPHGRLARLRGEKDHWNIAYARMREIHRDTYNGRRKVGCCGKSSRSSTSRTPSTEPVTEASLTGQDVVLMEYGGRRQGSFFVRGKSSGIRYRLSGRRRRFEAHPDDVASLSRMPSIRRARVQPEKVEKEPEPEPESRDVAKQSYDPKMLDESVDIDALERELEAHKKEAVEPGVSEEEVEEIEEEVDDWGERNVLDWDEAGEKRLDVPDPADYGVLDMRSAHFDVTPEQAEVMIEMEKRGKNRVTAIEALERKL